jgi:hypothetical protein
MAKKEEASLADRNKIIELARTGKVELHNSEKTESSLKAMLAAIKSGEKMDWTIISVELRGRFGVEWCTTSAGFGGFDFYTEGGKIRCDSETMSKEFIKSVLCKLVDIAELDD